MSNEIQRQTKTFFEAPAVQAKFKKILGENAPAFTTSVLQIVSQNQMLQGCEPISIFNAAIQAATMNLPINNNLGFAYIVPYGNKAQFQMGYKGFIQLAQRSGQFQKISATPIYEGQILSNNPLTGITYDFDVKANGEPIGFSAYFKLLNGFEADLYMSREEIDQHAKRYSKMYGKGVWKTDFEAMARKTVIKLLLSRYAPLSIDSPLSKAINTDQAVIEDEEGEELTYIDNPNQEEGES